MNYHFDGMKMWKNFCNLPLSLDEDTISGASDTAAVHNEHLRAASTFPMIGNDDNGMGITPTKGTRLGRRHEAAASQRKISARSSAKNVRFDSSKDVVSVVESLKYAPERRFLWYSMVDYQNFLREYHNKLALAKVIVAVERESRQMVTNTKILETVQLLTTTNPQIALHKEQLGGSPCPLEEERAGVDVESIPRSTMLRKRSLYYQPFIKCEGIMNEMLAPIPQHKAVEGRGLMHHQHLKRKRTTEDLEYY